MPIKVYFNSEIHRFAKLPIDLKALTDTITSTFRAQLPSSWIVQHTDEDGDLIMITHDCDYKELQEQELKNPSHMFKLIISSVCHSEKISNPSMASLQPNKKDESFELIPTISQDNREKTADADFILNFVGQNQLIEVLPRADPQPQNEGSNLLSTNKRVEEESNMDNYQIESSPKVNEPKMDSKKPMKNRRPKKEKIEELSEEQLKALEIMKIFKGMMRAQRKGDTESVVKHRGELIAKAPELKVKLDALFEAIDQGKDQKELKQLCRILKKECKGLYGQSEKAEQEKEKSCKRQKRVSKPKQGYDQDFSIQELSEQQIRLFTNFQTFRGLIKAYKKGEFDKIAEYQVTLELAVPELKTELNQLSQVLVQEGSQKAINSAANNLRTQFVQKFFPEGKVEMTKQFKCWKRVQKGIIKEQRKNHDNFLPELTKQQLKIFQNKAMFNDMILAYKAGDTQRMLECRNKLEAEVPELKSILDSMSQTFLEGADYSEVRKSMRAMKMDFIDQFFPQGLRLFRNQWKHYRESLTRECKTELRDKKTGWFWSAFSRRTNINEPLNERRDQSSILLEVASK